MIDFEKILEKWKTFTEEEKEQYYLFTLFMARWHGMDEWWSSREAALSENDMKKLREWLPIGILQDMDKKQKEEDDRFEKFCEASFINGEIKEACEKAMKAYENYFLSEQVRYNLMYDIENNLKTSFEDKSDRLNRGIELTIKNEDGGLNVRFDAVTPFKKLSGVFIYKINIINDELNVSKFLEMWKQE